MIQSRPQASAPAAMSEPVRAEQRLLNYAKQALRLNPRSYDSARDAFFKLVKQDAEALWIMFAEHRVEATQRVLAEAGSQLSRGLEPIPIANYVCPTEHEKRMAAALQARRRGQPAAIAALGLVAERSLLDRFKIGSRSIGDATPRQARKWAARRGIETRWVALLTENLPPDEPIRKYRSDEVAESFMRQARAELIEQDRD